MCTVLVCMVESRVTLFPFPCPLPLPSLTPHSSLGVVIVSCSGCNRKFATQRSAESQTQHLCRNCRGGLDDGQAVTAHTTSTPVSSNSLRKTVAGFHNVTPVKSPVAPVGGSGGKGRKRCSQPPVSCKVCGLTFVYRRCIFRHLREVHNIRDANEIYQYIGMGPDEGGAEDAGDEAARAADDGTQVLGTDSSLNVTVGSEVDPMACDEMDLEAAGGEGGAAEAEIINSSSVQMEQMVLLESLARRNVEMVSGREDMAGGGGGGGERKEEGGGDGREGSEAQEINASSLFANGKSFQCEVCNKMFDRPYRLQRHLQIHDPNRRRVSCQICDRMFTREDTLQNHIRCLHSDERPYKCTDEGCYKAFASQSALIQHLKSHMNGKPYRCNECPASFALLSIYKQHMHKDHAETEALRCSDCYRVFADRDGLDQHKLLEHRYECEICGKAFARLAYLEQHARVHEGSGLFNCKFCSLGFDNEYAFKQHMKAHPARGGSSGGGGGGGKMRTLQCPVCSVTFQHQSNLLSHLGSQEHREKAAALGLSLNTIEGDLSPEVSALVDEVTMQEENLLQSISESEEFQGQAAPVDQEDFVEQSVSEALQTIASQQ